MCGICGVIYKDVISSLNRESLHNAIGIMEHRGPDERGIFTSNNIGLGHTRLSILDLTETGAQPMTLEDGSLTIVFNGEIYNHLELREELKADGCQFKGRSDTETILKGYRKWGNSVFIKLNGVFSIAIYDKNNKKVLIARDRFGVKPLYLYKDGDKIIFASEIKSILKIYYK